MVVVIFVVVCAVLLLLVALLLVANPNLKLWSINVHLSEAPEG